MEEASTLLGHYDVGTDAVYHTLQVQHDPAVVDGLLATNDYGSADPNYPDGYYDEGFSNTVSGGFSELDSQQLFLGTVTYLDIDGTVKTLEDVPFNVYQLENGDTYIAPTTEITSPASGLFSDGGEFTASILSGREILSVDLTTLRNDAIGHDNLIYDYESVQDQVQTFYLGNKVILDTTQGNGTMEDAATLLGSYNATSGAPGDGQFTLHTLNAYHDPAVNDGLLATNDYGASALNPDGYYDEGFSNAPTAGQNGTTFSELDSQQLFWGDVYYIDANGNEQVMHNVGLNVYQLENGDVFAVPTREIVSENGTYADANDTSPSVLAGLSISRIELTSLRNDAIGHDNLLYDSESISDGTLGANLAIDGNAVIDTACSNDIIDAAAGDDTVDAGLGDDLVYGGLGDDHLLGNVGNDRLVGDEGADTLTGGEGADTLFGGQGDDLIAVGGADIATGGTGDDRFVLDPTDTGSDVSITLDGESDATDGNQDDVANGDAGDILDLSGSGADVSVTLEANGEDGTVNGLDADAATDITFADIENLVLGAGNDTIDASAATLGVNVASGDGNDTLLGGAGDDTLVGEGGADVIDGGAGDDLIDVGALDGVTDTVVMADGDGNDVVRGFEGPIDNGDGTFTPQDQLDVSDLTDADGNPVDVADVTVDVDPEGNPVLTFPNGESVTLEGANPDTYRDPVTGEPLQDALAAIGIPDNRDDIVDGTPDADTMAPGYIDGQGDIIDGIDGLDDTIQAGAGDDTVDAGLGDDLVYGGLGDDSILGGGGNDSIFGSEGADTVDGGDGNDYINTRTSPGLGLPDSGLIHPIDSALSYPADTDPNNDSDLVFGGAGSDTILSGDDDDTVYGGAGDDVIDAGFDADIVFGEAGADIIQGGEGADTIYGGEDDDVIYGGLSPLDPLFETAQLYDLTDDLDPDPENNADLLIGGDGDDQIFGEDDGDTLEGGLGNDTLDGGIDDDSLYGGAGDDILIGGQGNDTLDGGTGNDTLTGGSGNDVFVWDGDSDVTITDWQAGITGTIDNGDQSDNDVLDLSPWFNAETLTEVNNAGGAFGSALGMLRADAEDGVIDGIIDGVDYSTALGIGGSLELLDASPSQLTAEATNVVCFARGTHIIVRGGEVAIEHLKVGDEVLTMDQGFQPIRWIGSTKVAGKAHLAPILFEAGSINNKRDLRVSPQHRMFISAKIADILFGHGEVLAAAKHLVNHHSIRIQECEEVEYFHILFDEHQIVFAEGCPSESFHPGLQGWGTLDKEARTEVLELFPQLADDDFSAYGPSARPTLKAHEAKLVVSSAMPVSAVA